MLLIVLGSILGLAVQLLAVLLLKAFSDVLSGKYAAKKGWGKEIHFYKPKAICLTFLADIKSIAHFLLKITARLSIKLRGYPIDFWVKLAVLSFPFLFIIVMSMIGSKLDAIEYYLGRLPAH